MEIFINLVILIYIMNPENEYDSDNNGDIDTSDYDYDGADEGSAEKIQDKPTIDNFFDTENLLYSLEKTFRGFQKQNKTWVYVTRPIARDEFINLTINSLRSVINPENIISKKSAEEIEIILLEKNLEFIDLCEDESIYTLNGDYFESIVNIFDHTLELFMGLVQGGHGAQTLKEIYAGVARDINAVHNSQEDSGFRLAVGDKDLINIGMKR